MGRSDGCRQSQQTAGVSEPLLVFSHAAVYAAIDTEHPHPPFNPHIGRIVGTDHHNVGIYRQQHVGIDVARQC